MMTRTEQILNEIRILIKELNTITSGVGSEDPSILSELESIDTWLEELYIRQNRTEPFQDVFVANVQYGYTTFNGDVVVSTRTLTDPYYGSTVVFTYSYAIVDGETVLTQITRS